MRAVRRTLLTIVALYAILFCWSLFRRVFQVLRLEVSASSSVLVPGSKVSIDVVTTGEVQNRILLELVQDAQTQTLLDFQGRLSASNTVDPRVFRYSPTVTITPELLARFHAGSATLRLTGFGGYKLLRLPAPRTRALEIQLSGRERCDSCRGEVRLWTGAGLLIGSMIPARTAGPGAEAG